MIWKEMMGKRFVIVLVLGAIVSAVMVNGYLGRAGPGSGGDSDPAAVSREDSREGSGELGADSEEGSGAASLALDETFDRVRGGARLILRYDTASNAFKGTVENTTSGVLDRVRVEVHLSNGAELGPTTPVNMAAGAVMGIEMPATASPFTGWTAHAEAGRGGEAGGEHGSRGEGGREHGSGG